MERRELLSRAVDECLKEIYSYAEPKVEWDDFIKEISIYSNKYKFWEQYHKAFSNREKYPEEWTKFQAINPQWEGKSINECIGPRPYEFYYIPKEIMRDIFDSYVSAYKIDNHQNLLDIIEILKNYCKKPTVDKYIEGELREDGTRWPGHRGYDHPDNLEKEVYRIVYDIIHPISGIGTHFNFETISKQACNKFFEFLDMAGKFYNWNSELSSFGTNVYLGPSPNSDKDRVIENWKKYKNQDISINEEQMLKEYYGEDD